MPSRPPTHQPKTLKAKRHAPAAADRQATRALNTGSKAWRLLRDQVLVRDGYRCQACGLLVTGREAHVDHRDGNSHNNNPNNLACLCLRCHSSKTRTEQNGGTWTRRPYAAGGAQYGGEGRKSKVFDP